MTRTSKQRFYDLFEYACLDPKFLEDMYEFVEEERNRSIDEVIRELTKLKFNASIDKAIATVRSLKITPKQDE